MPRPLAEQVVVITGASTGIGRLTASHLAERGTKVAMIARREQALVDLEREIRDGGGEAMACPADVTDADAIFAIADRVVERWGRIDTWVNGAAVFVQGRADEVTPEEFRRVLDVNLLGYVIGTQAALRHMKRQGAGTIIQISSVLARRGVPYTSPYSAAKAAIDGFSEALRAELWGSGIEVAILYPPTVDTPVYQHALAKWGTVPKPPPPVEDPIHAAKAIAELAERPRRNKTFGIFGRAYSLFSRLLPTRAQDWIIHRGAGFMVSDIPHGDDNLWTPMDDEPRVRGGWQDEGLRGLTLRDLVRVLPVETAVAGALLVGLVLAAILKLAALLDRADRE